MRKVKIYQLLTVILLLLLIAQLTIAQNQIPVSVISSGGDRISSASYMLSSTVGEPFIGKSVNTTNQQNTGFWYVYNQSTITAVEEGGDESVPTIFKLGQNYPNPFNPSTIIKFGVPERSNVLIKIYDILGNEVVTLVDEQMEAGWYSRDFNASGYSTGVYIFTMQAGNYTNTKKMILIK